MDGFKQWRISDGHLADVLILSTQESLQLTALHKSIQSTGYFGGKAPMSPPSKSSPSLPSLQRQQEHFSEIKAAFWPTPKCSERGEKTQLCNFPHNQASLSVAEACKRVNIERENPQTLYLPLKSTCSCSLIGLG